MEASRDKYCEDCSRGLCDRSYCPSCYRWICPQSSSGPPHCKHTRRLRSNLCFIESEVSLFFYPEFKSLHSKFSTVIDVLCEAAQSGDLFRPYEELLRATGERSGRGRADCQAMLERAVKSGNVRLYHRLPLPNGALFVSLNLAELSVKALLWAIFSLQQDLMTPSDTQVLSRLKEAFAINITAKDWRKFVTAIADKKPLQDKLNTHVPAQYQLSVQKADDGTLLFELAGLKWRFEDNADVSAYDPQYRALVAFFEKELGEGGEVQGGKYGCAVLAKIKGPPPLRECSLGRLCTLVKAALQNQVLVHRKTSVTWNHQVEIDERKKNLRTFELQTAVLEIMKEHSERGVPLAQLPFMLERRLGSPPDLTSLGFNKLKDFLTTLDDYLLIEPDEENRLRALPRPKTTREKIHIVTRKLVDILSQYSCQIEIGRLQDLLAKALGEGFAPQAFGVRDFEEFLLSKCADSFEVECCKDRFNGQVRKMVQMKKHSLKKDNDFFGFPYQVIPPDSISTAEPPGGADDDDECSREKSADEIFDLNALKFFNNLLNED